MVERNLAVVGAGVAGLTAAETAVRLDYPGRVVLIGDEPHHPYDRPPLSKQILSGEWDVERVALRRPEIYPEWRPELRLSARAVGVDLSDRQLHLEGGEHLAFDELVVATGVQAARLPFGRDLANVHVLRTIDDALSLSRELQSGGPLVVVGAGFLGTEAAASARKLGLDVTVVDSLAEPLGRAVGDWIGGHVRRLHIDHGVTFRLGVGVQRFITTGDRVHAVELSDGTTVPAAAVLVAIGSHIDVGWLDGSGLADGSGVRCDEFSLAAPNVAAAGDIASWHNVRFGHRMRAEHRMNAQEQATAAVTNLLRPPEERVPFAPVPYFWSDQYDVKLQAYGVLTADAEVTLAEGRPEDNSFVAAFRVRDRLVGAVGWNAARAMRTYRTKIMEDSDEAVGTTPTVVG